eukprot:TRINITY_DN55493_c0_g1_i1.p1 TRINITY_DN55493_c0_g1~~TRINITY_DN55493_c0_g1_i1.p1  ORF type:complete len:465 (+),score=85.64 TRINITY_DN55493_c0_g1_i1:84-1478(+)
MEPVKFSITSSEDEDNPVRFSLGPKDAALSVGRNKKSSIVVNQAGVSWTHLEIHYRSEGDEPGLAVKDTSSNGVLLRKVRGGPQDRLEKDALVAMTSGACLILPYRVRAAPGQKDSELQTTLTLHIDGVDSPSSMLSESEPEEEEAAPVNGDAEKPAAEAAAAAAAPAEEKEEGETKSPSRRKSPLRTEDLEIFNPEASPEVERKGKRKKSSAEDGKKKSGKDEEKKSKKVKHSFAPGQFVRVVNLKAKGDLNGKVGLLVEWEESKGFWKVRMEDGTGKAFRPANLEPHVVPPPTLPAAAGADTVPPPPPSGPAPPESVPGPPGAPPGPPPAPAPPATAPPGPPAPAAPQVAPLPMPPGVAAPGLPVQVATAPTPPRLTTAGGLPVQAKGVPTPRDPPPVASLPLPAAPTLPMPLPVMPPLGMMPMTLGMPMLPTGLPLLPPAIPLVGMPLPIPAKSAAPRPAK